MSGLYSRAKDDPVVGYGRPLDGGGAAALMAAHGSHVLLCSGLDGTLEFLESKMKVAKTAEEEAAETPRNNWMVKNPLFIGILVLTVG